MHVWLPGAYAEADDDVSAMLSAVISKVSMFGLLVGTYVAIRSEADLESRTCARLDRHAHDACRRHAGGAPGRHEAHAGLFEHEPARLHRDRGRADEPSRLGHRALSRRQPSDGQGDPVSRRRRDHFSHRHPHVRRARRPRPSPCPLRLRPRRGHRGHVRVAAARRLRRQMAAAQRDDGERVVWAGSMGLLATFVGFLYMARFIQAIFLGPPKTGARQDCGGAGGAPRFAISA